MKILNKYQQLLSKNSFIFKIIISFLILYFVFSNLDISKIILSLNEVNLFYLIPSLPILLIILIFMTLKWDIFLEKYEAVDIRRLIKVYWASDFINLFGLGSVGSEAYKMFSFKNKKKILFSSLIDRGYSFIWYIFLGGSIAMAYFTIGGNNIYTMLLGVIIFFSVAFIYISVDGKIKRGAYKLIKNRFIKKLIFESQKDKKVLLIHATYCLIIIFLQVVVYSLIFFAVGFKINTIELFIFIPLLTIALVLPFSFQGFGIREFLFIELAKWNTLSPEKALVSSFLLYIIGLTYRLFGSMPFLMLRER